MPALEEIVEPNEGIDAIQDNPDQSPEEEDAGYGENNIELPQQLQDALKSLVQEFQAQETWERRREILRDSRNRHYSAGHQHIYEKSNGMYCAATPGGSMQNSAGESVQCPDRIRDYNIFEPFERTVTSVLTQNPPGVDFRAIDPSNTEDMESAEAAEGFRKHFDMANDVKEIQTNVVRMMLLSGRVVTWTRTEGNAQRFGLKPDGTARKNQTADAYGAIETKVSTTAKRQEDCPYLILAEDHDVKMMKEKYPEFAEKIKPDSGGIGENAYERVARLSVLQGSRGQGQLGGAHLSTQTHCWLRPAAFHSDRLDEQLDEAGPNDVVQEGPRTGQKMNVREKLKELFPLGCHVVFVGEIYVGSWAESMDDHIHIDFPSPGDGMSRPAPLDKLIVIQDDFNDDMNAYWEAGQYGWPSTWIDSDETELDAINDQKSVPYAIRAKKANTQRPLGDSFYREPDANIPQALWNKTLFLMGQLAQFIIAAPPALFGSSMQDQKTASGYAQARAQAMGQQGIAWAAIQRTWARIYYQAAKCALKDPDATEIVVPGANGTNNTYQLEKLGGNFGAYPDQDSSFPEGTDAKRATFMQLIQIMGASPLGIQLLDNPDNIAALQSYFGFSELKFTEAICRDKQLAEIEVLLQQSPVPPSPEALQQAQIAHASAAIQAEAMGGPEPPPIDIMSLLQPSVPVDELDYHQYEGKKGQDWLSSEDCRRQLANGNQEGVMNVRLHTKQHLEMAKALAAPPPMPMPAGPPHAGPAHGTPPVGNGVPKPPGATQKHPIAAPPGAPGAPTM